MNHSSLPLIIVNPSSAGGSTGERWAGIASDIRTHFGAFECAFTQKANDARDIARRETESGRAFIIACGGDGTINEVANGILEVEGEARDKSELGILPSGTGGDFRRTLEMPTNIPNAARALREGITRTIDAGRVTFTNGEGVQSSRYFLGVSSTGIAGDALERVKGNPLAWLPASSSRWLGGQFSFAAAALGAVMRFEKPTLMMRVDDGEERRVTITNLCVANARYFGGGMKIAPRALLDDGLLDLVIIGDIERSRVVMNIHKLYAGTHLDLDEVQHARIRRVHVRSASDELVKIEADGEIVGHLPATFEVIPKALRVRCKN